ncbi:hypothetical protein HYH02_000906 [Chlamydomonas schloesseri]|uniref:Uncharacterized protein n=1 Tax=Chlamydomonas schloesseri TaxID=2026947 RepID=A0A835WZH8_9CHLO|nr:hypothetical protein HYH02_000906 [Chlamydomonas schloesseri]|eukprot:KAG2455085.1 hypothetical protein HYH02_000906 [Chlamydomonas schloesseri]
MKAEQVQQLVEYAQPESVAQNEYLAALQYRPGLPSGPSGSDSFDHTSYHVPNSPSSRAHHFNRPSPGSHCDTAACPGDAVIGSHEVAKAAKGASICSPRQSACQIAATTATNNVIDITPRELPSSPSPNSASEPSAQLHIQSPPPAATAATHQPNFGSQALWPQQHTWATTAAATCIPATAAPISSPRHAQDLDHRRRSGAAVAAALAAAAPVPMPDASLGAPTSLVQARLHSHQHHFQAQSDCGGYAATANVGSSDPMHTDSADEGTGCSGVALPGGGAAAPAGVSAAVTAAAAEAPAAAAAGVGVPDALDADAAGCGDDNNNVGELFRVNSLAMSDPEVQLLDALLKGSSDDDDDNGVGNGVGTTGAGGALGTGVDGTAVGGGGFLGGEGMSASGAAGAGAAGAFGAGRAVRPTSFGGAIGPFAEASLQPTLSDYSGRASPGELEDDAVLLAGLEAAADQLDADSASAAAAGAASAGGGATAGAPPAPELAGACMGTGEVPGAVAPPPQQQQLPHAHLQALRHQPHLLNAYSEPLPFSAPLPHHLALHPNAPGSLAPVTAPAAAAAPVPAAGHAAAPAAPLSFAAASPPGNAMSPGPKPPAPHPPPPHLMAPHASATAAASPPAPSPSSPCMGAGNVGSSSPPQLQHQSSAHTRTPHRLSRTMPTLEEHGLLPPAHSAPAVNCGIARSPPPMPATVAVSSGGVCSPMHVDGGPGMEPRVGSCHSFGAYGAGAAGGSSSGGCAPCGGGSGSSAAAKAPAAPGGGHHSSGGGAGVRGSTSGADGGATSAGGAGPDLQAHAPAQAGRAVGQYVSPFDVRGKRVRQHDGPAPAPLASGPAAALPNSGAPAGTGAAAATAKGFGRPSSPNSHSHSVGDPMSIGTGAADPSAGGYAHPHHLYAPYHPAYGMYPPPGPCGMPYDPYYPYGYPHPHGHHPGYPDAPPPPPPPPPHGAAGDPYGAHAPPPYDMAAAGGPRAPMHYPGFMVPRQRLYRRFMSGLRGCDAAVPPVLMASGPFLPGAAAAGGAAEGAGVAGGGGGNGPALMPMGSAPVTSAAASAAVAAPNAAAALRLSGQGASVAQLRTASATAATGGAATSSEAAALAATETDGMQAARQCHDMFTDDDVALPLPLSTVDGIRQELRAVTQELIQRRMGAAASVAAAAVTAAVAALGGGNKVAAAAAAHGAAAAQPPPLQPTPVSASCVSAPPGHGGSHSSLLHKRPSAGPDASGAFSPPRIRPAPSAPAANVFAAAFGSSVAAAAPPARCQDASASWSAGGAGASSSAVPASLQPPALYTSDPCSVSQLGLGSPPAMRQLFPGPAAPAGPGFGVRPGSASAPLGPRPAVSGSTVSVCHSASGAQPLPPGPAPPAQQPSGEARFAQHQDQAKRSQAPQSGMGMSTAHQQQPHMSQGSGAVAPIAIGTSGPAYRVGQQGSVAAEAEGEVEGGEEVHGPAVHRNSATNGALASGASAGAVGGVGGPAQPSSARAPAAAGPGPAAAPPQAYYPAPGPYDYHGYGAYYPPGVYGSRPGYGMYPPPHYGMPPPGGYRGGMYGMHPPPPTYGPTAWPDYTMPPPGSGAPRS